ncbi:MAG: proteasome assembly chaperone family protein [Acidimicrobiia bacterium]
MSGLYELHERPELERPTLVIALEGWVDAGFAAAGAAQALTADISWTTVATFDTDALIDYRARRPVMHLRDGVNTGLTWPILELRYGVDRVGNDVLLLAGHEPDTLWKRFATEVIELAQSLAVVMVCGLGAYPTAVPHTRPSPLSVTATSEELAGRYRLVRNSVDVPAGIQAVLEHGFSQQGVPALGLWAQVPHYIAQMPYPPASLVLLETLQNVSGVTIRPEGLREAAFATRIKVDQLVANSEEHAEMVRQLERHFDAEVTAEPMPNDLPSGDEIAAELERFLRDQGA